MDIRQLWDKALRQTEIRRMRMLDLATFESTAVPYVFLAESAVNQGDTVVRKGQVLVERPAIVLPPLSPQFEGFDFAQEWQVSEDAVATFLVVRGVQFPSFRYRHQLSSLDVVEAPLEQAIAKLDDHLRRAEDVKTGLLIGPEDVWQFSVLILVGALVVRSAQGDLRRILEEWRKRQQSP